MKRKVIQHSHNVGIYDTTFYEGETIEDKCARITQNKEPISDGAPLIYTEKKDGVLPQYNIRTDKWAIAQEAMDVANKAKIAQGNKTPQKEEKKEETKDNQETKSE